MGAATKRKQAYRKICPVCGKSFNTTNNKKTTCSVQCQRRREQQTIADPFRPVTPATELLVQWYRDDDHMSAEQIAMELKRDVIVIEKLLAKIERQEKV